MSFCDHFQCSAIDMGIFFFLELALKYVILLSPCDVAVLASLKWPSNPVIKRWYIKRWYIKR